jgi:hypothetical protein
MYILNQAAISLTTSRKWQYENKFREWAFKKNHGGAVRCKVIKCRLQKRPGENEVYIDRLFQSAEKVRHTIRQQTFQTTMEKRLEMLNSGIVNHAVSTIANEANKPSPFPPRLLKELLYAILVQKLCGNCSGLPISHVSISLESPHCR